jgi:tRNA isopentenyl-2-thiomethyl-A-37 hydroxylase MiaE
MNELKCGTYLRWINLDNTNSVVLSKGAIFCELKITNEGVFLICKNVGFNSRHFQISLDKHLIFQKLTEQELVLLSALDHLSK